MSDSLPPELARRIDALEARPAAPDFDPLSWVWLALLGLVLPIALLILGWNAG
jgi:hypothetical protein